MMAHLLQLVCPITVTFAPAPLRYCCEVELRILCVVTSRKLATTWSVGLVGIVMDCQLSSKSIKFWVSSTSKTCIRYDAWCYVCRWELISIMQSAGALWCVTRENGERSSVDVVGGLISITITRLSTWNSWKVCGGCLSRYGIKDMCTEDAEWCLTVMDVIPCWVISRLSRITKKSLIHPSTSPSPGSKTPIPSLWRGRQHLGPFHPTWHWLCTHNSRTYVSTILNSTLTSLWPSNSWENCTPLRVPCSQRSRKSSRELI